jgi:phenylacetate-CoA ligase
MRRLASIAGRLDERLLIGGATVLPGQIEALVLKHEGLEPVYQLLLTQEGGADRLAVSAEVSAALAADNPARERLAGALRQEILDLTGIAADVRLHSPGTLERSTGRARRVLDQRPPPAAA